LNDNFNYLEDKIEDYSKNIETDKASLVSLINSQIETVNAQFNSKLQKQLEALYPVGSMYMGTTTSCPIASLFGSWTKVGTAIVTNVNTEVAIKGNGKTLGLTNGTQNGGLYTHGDYIKAGTAVYNTNVGSTATTSADMTTLKTVGLTKDASKSGVVGTATVTNLTVNIWKRTA
jgi:hypothetical protein